MYSNILIGFADELSFENGPMQIWNLKIENWKIGLNNDLKLIKNMILKKYDLFFSSLIQKKKRRATNKKIWKEKYAKLGLLCPMLLKSSIKGHYKQGIKAAHTAFFVSLKKKR